MTDTQSWFVYYKVPAMQGADAARRAQGIAGALAPWAKPAPRVMRKLDDAAVATLMEVYEGIADPQGFSDAMARAVAASGMPREWIDARRVERFVSTG